MTISLDGADTSRVAPSRPRVTLLRAIAGIVTSVLAIAVFVTVAWIAAVGSDPSTLFMRWFGVRHDFAALYTSLGIAPLPGDAMTSTVYGKFLKLESEPCDFAALNAAAKNLVTSHHERIAATALQGFARRCNDDPRAEREASGILFKVGDCEAARHGFADLVARFPQNELDWYHKGQAEAGLKRNDEALESYATTISLTRNPAQIGAWVFEEMAAIYAAEGRFCEAMTAIDTYISIGRRDRDNNRTRQLLATYAKKGNCARYAAGSDSFPVYGTGVIRVRATVSGVTGTFAVDTGASFVTLTNDFAQRAHITTNGVAHAMTANGEAEFRLSRAASVGVGRLHAADVPVIVSSKPMGDIDGLLGRSFLARFEMTITGDRMLLKVR